jgi:hypothetical protein
MIWGAAIAERGGRTSIALGCSWRVMIRLATLSRRIPSSEYHSAVFVIFPGHSRQWCSGEGSGFRGEASPGGTETDRSITVALAAPSTHGPPSIRYPRPQIVIPILAMNMQRHDGCFFPSNGVQVRAVHRQRVWSP